MTADGSGQTTRRRNQGTSAAEFSPSAFRSLRTTSESDDDQQGRPVPMEDVTRRRCTACGNAYSIIQCGDSSPFCGACGHTVLSPKPLPVQPDRSDERGVEKTTLTVNPAALSAPMFLGGDYSCSQEQASVQANKPCGCSAGTLRKQFCLCAACLVLFLVYGIAVGLIEFYSFQSLQAEVRSIALSGICNDTWNLGIRGQISNPSVSSVTLAFGSATIFEQASAGAESLARVSPIGAVLSIALPSGTSRFV